MAHLKRVNAIKDEAIKAWGPNQPRVRVVHSPDLLPDSVKRDPRYQHARGVYYDGKVVYLVAPNLRTRGDVLRTLAHEAVGHYGVDRIVDEVLGKGAWDKISAKLEALRADPSKANSRMQALLAEVERRYRAENGAKADPLTFAREFMAVSAEKGINNSLLDRVVTAVRQWLRQVMPSLTVSDAELRQLLVKSEAYLRGGDGSTMAGTVPAAAYSTSGEPLSAYLNGPHVTEVARGMFREGAGSLSDRVSRWYAAEHDSRASNPELGTVMLTRRGVKDSIAHGIGADKADAFAAVPSIIQRGRIVSREEPYKGGTVNRYVIAAPFRMEGEDYVGAVVVQRDANTQRFYLHEVALREKLRQPFKTGALTSSEAAQTGGAGAIATILRDAVSGKLDATEFSLDRRTSNDGGALKSDSEAARNLRRFMAGSKAVDAQGQPLLLYHGTADEFSVFGKDRAGEATGHATSPLGHFLTPDLAQAEGYARNASEGRPADERVIGAYVASKHPYTMSLREAQAIKTPAEARAARARLEAAGHDGIHLPEQNAWVALDSRQIKSADAH